MNIKDFLEKLLKWYEEGLWVVNNYAFDVGNLIAIALRE
jgi:hypothetical protein